MRSAPEPPSSERPAAASSRVDRLLASLDPVLVEASREVDRSLLRWMMRLSPRERLDVSSRAAGALGRLRREASEAS